MPQSAEEFCRLCLSKERMMLPVFQNTMSKDQTTFRTKIMSCVSVEIFADDELPSNICYMCVHQVEKFFQFQTMCKNSDSVLKLQLRDTSIGKDTKENTTSIEEDICEESEKQNVVPDYYLPGGSSVKNIQLQTCSICGTVFLSNSLLIDHLIKDHPDVNIIFCNNCKLSFPTVGLYKNHLDTQHNLTCNHCDFVFKNENNLKDHLKIHTTDYLHCKFCSEKFSNLIEMKKHELNHSNKICGYCDKELDTQNDYNSHCNECEGKHFCKFCSQGFKLKKDLIEHVNSKHDSSAVEKNINHQQQTILDEIQEIKYESDDDQLLKCTNCDVKFPDETSLGSHMTTEHDDSVFSCRFCGKKFELRTSLKRHERSHSGMKPYQCKFCPRKFKDSSTCVVHTRTHTGEHPFRCEECHKDFKQLANLKMHTYRHHKKDKNVSHVKSEILTESRNEFENLYGGNVMENYSNDNIRDFQGFGDNITNTFS